MTASVPEAKSVTSPWSRRSIFGSSAALQAINASAGASRAALRRITHSRAITAASLRMRRV